MNKYHPNVSVEQLDGVLIAVLTSAHEFSSIRDQYKYVSPRAHLSTRSCTYHTHTLSYSFQFYNKEEAAKYATR